MDDAMLRPLPFTLCQLASQAAPKVYQRRIFTLLCGLALLLFSAPWVSRDLFAATPTTVEVYADGLFNPKGMAFGPDDLLYITESGKPGVVLVPLPAAYGDAPLGDTGRISVLKDGERTDVVTGLPNMGLYGGTEILGPTALTVVNGRLFYVPGLHLTELPRLYELVDGKLEAFAEVGKFNEENPPPPSNGDAAIGNPYDMVTIGEDIYITDGNFNRVLKVGMDGSIRIFAAYENSPVTTGAAADKEGNLYIAQFSPAPYFEGSSTVDRISPSGQIEVGYISNLTNAIEIAFDSGGIMYVLQFASAFNPEKLVYKPGGGKLLRVLQDRSTEEVVTGLSFPTAMKFSPDGTLYISNFGHQANDGQGQVLKVRIGDLAAVAPPVGQTSGKQWEEVPAKPDSVSEFIPEDDSTVVIKIVEGPDIQQWGYEPANIEVEPGTKIAFINTGTVPHNATASNGSFATVMLKPGEHATVTVSEVGDNGYFCSPHPWMKGLVRVVAPGSLPSSSPPATAKTQLERRPLGFSGTSPVEIALLMLGVFLLLFVITRLFGAKQEA
jgi:plastocyanin/sugar lactone lactonase YvrE